MRREKPRAGGVILNQKGLVVIVSNRGVTWSFPKGSIEDGESPFEAAQREVYEETGIIDLEFCRDLGQYERYRNGFNGQDDKSELKIIHLFLFKSNQEVLKPVDPHNPEARWVTKEEALKMLTHHKDREFFQSIMNLI